MSAICRHTFWQKEKWKHVVLPLVATKDQTYETASGSWRRRKGELLRPDVFDPEDLDDLRESSFNPDFEMLYQQDFDLQALPAIRADHFGTFLGPMPSRPDRAERRCWNDQRAKKRLFGHTGVESGG